MRPARPVSRTAAVAALALAVPVFASAAQAAPKDYRGRTIYVTTADNALVSVAAARPGTVLTRRGLTGLPAGVTLKGLDFRPATGDLYGLGSDAVVYRVNPRTAIAVGEGPAIAAGLSGTLFGVDFNPTVDRIRITSDERQNLRADPDAGTAVVDAPINPDADVVAVAYTASFVNAVRPTATVLYGVDTATDTLQILNPPNAGTLTEGKPLGVDVGPDANLDIAGKRNVAYLSSSAADGTATLYTVDLATGTATSVGRIGDGTVTVTALAAQQDIQRTDLAWAAPRGGR